MEQDVIDPLSNQVAYSQEEKGVKFQDGHYELPLPFRNGSPTLPYNKSVAFNS